MAASSEVHSRRRLAAWVAAGGAAFASFSAKATENGAQHYPVGVNTVADGNLPPPGMLQLLNYTSAANSSALVDGGGAKEPLNFHLRAAAEAVRLLYTWKASLGPFHYTTGVVLPLVNLDLRVSGSKGHDLNFADLDIQNFLGYSGPDGKLFLSIGVDTFVPTGHYNYYSIINTGSNYYTVAPNVNFTYNFSQAVAASFTLFSEFNSTNGANHYQSGSDVDMDFGVTIRPFKSLPHLGLGPQGYFYNQISNDTIYGKMVAPNGYRGRAYALGPQVRYDIPYGAFILKYQREFAVENRPRGDNIWFQFAMPIR